MPTSAATQTLDETAAVVSAAHAPWRAAETANVAADLRDLAVVAPNLHWRYSGVTSTIIALVPRLARRLPIASLGPFLPADVPRISLGQLLTCGWSKPPGRKARIWHARRNDEMILGLLLRHVLRQPWRLVFTSAAQRRHTAFTRWMLRRMDGVIATSEGAAAYLEVDSTVIEHGVDTERFRPSAARAAAWKETGLPGRFGVGVFGRVRSQKGTDLFVEAMIRLLPKYPDATAVVTGLVAPEHEAFAVGLQARAAEAGLKDRIVFLGERRSEEMGHWFRCVNIYVAPIRSEGFGLTPLEAMASGTAVVATRTGAAPQLVADGRTGVLVRPDDLEALVAAIEPLMADPALAESMGRLGREKALKQHDIETEASRIIEFYQQVWARC
jgi:mannosyltransferase